MDWAVLDEGILEGTNYKVTTASRPSEMAANFRATAPEVVDRLLELQHGVLLITFLLNVRWSAGCLELITL